MKHDKLRKLAEEGVARFPRVESGPDAALVRDLALGVLSLLDELDAARVKVQLASEGVAVARAALRRGEEDASRLKAEYEAELAAARVRFSRLAQSVRVIG